MNEQLRNQIVQRRQAGASIRGIARALGIARQSVERTLAQVAAQRAGQTSPPTMPQPPRRRPSLLDAYEPVLRELLGRYADMTARRLYEELRACAEITYTTLEQTTNMRAADRQLLIF